MNTDLMYAILAMDSYNRGYNPGINMTGNTLGTATIPTVMLDGQQVNLDSAIIVDPNTGERLDDDIGFYAVAYSYNGGTVISYRGTDDKDDPEADQLDSDLGWGTEGTKIFNAVLCSARRQNARPFPASS